MATIRPFRGLRYSKGAGSIEKLVAPPYDVISPAQRDELAAQSPANIVHLTLPEARDDDRSKYVKYARSAAALAEWRRNGILELEPKPAFYRYTQTFSVPGAGQAFERTKIMVLLKVEPYENGVVLPHEQTFPKHKEDRLRILEATRAHLECIYGLFEDPDRSIHDRIVASPASSTVELTSDEGVLNRLEVVDDPESLGAIAQALADKKVWIADGHHRYETAVHFRSLKGEADELIAEDFMMMALSSMSDPGLVILPTHRIVSALPCSEADLAARLSERFEVERAPNESLLEEIAKAQPHERALGVALPSGTGLILWLRDASIVSDWIPGDDSPRLKMLDVSILHKIVFEQILGLSGLDFFSYTRDPEEALAAVRDGAAAFLMNPPTVEDMRVIALGHEKMPQKSTYYYPKLLSGLVLWSLSDF